MQQPVLDADCLAVTGPFPTPPTSTLPGFYRLTAAERQRRLAELAELSDEDLLALNGDKGLKVELADSMVENVVGVHGLPLGLAVNLRIDGQDRLVPMAIEEPSVVAAASHAGKLLRAAGGIVTTVSAPLMAGQIQVLEVPDPAAAELALREATPRLLREANRCDPCLVRLGGGARSLEVRHLPPCAADDPVGHMLVAQLVVDVRDAMGANAINTMCEHLAPEVEEITGGRVRLRILTNLADRRLVRARGSIPLSVLENKGAATGRELAQGIVEASCFAERDPYRAATHNKGIMNGIDSVLVAFGQDWRAVEAGAHAYAALGGRYTALSRWRLRDGALHGELELPMAVGIVGGATTVLPTSRLARRIAEVRNASDLASIVAAVGLAQNLAALRALAAEGIQHGHMRLHARKELRAAVPDREPSRSNTPRVSSAHVQTQAVLARRSLCCGARR